MHDHSVDQKAILLVHRSAGHLTESQNELFNSIKRKYCQTPFRTFLDVFRAFECAPNRWTNMTCSEIQSLNAIYIIRQTSGEMTSG